MKILKSTAAVLILLGALTGCSAASVSESSSASSSETPRQEFSTSTSETDTDNTSVRIGSLKGPTSIGLVHMMEDAGQSDTYEFIIAAAADELLASMVSEQLDIALLPANMASILYNKTEGGVSVIDINTLGVLYLISGDSSISSWNDLEGKTIYLTGKGTTPDYVLQYLLKEQADSNGFSADSVTLEYKSEATEIAALLKENPEAVGLLPQPFAAAAMSQNEVLNIVFDMTAEWDALQGAGGSRLVTGVTVVRNDFLKEHRESVDDFLKSHESSAALANSDADATAALVVKAGIIEKESIAKKALPYCSIVYIDGEEMKAALSGYLHVLFEQNPKSVGGALPSDDFYYMPQ